MIKVWLQMVKLDLKEEKMKPLSSIVEKKTTCQNLGWWKRSSLKLDKICKYLGIMINGRLSFRGFLDCDRENPAMDD